MWRKAVVQAEGDEQGFADDVPMREPAPFHDHV